MDVSSALGLKSSRLGTASKVVASAELKRSSRISLLALLVVWLVFAAKISSLCVLRCVGELIPRSFLPRLKAFPISMRLLGLLTGFVGIGEADFRLTLMFEVTFLSSNLANAGTDDVLRSGLLLLDRSLS